MRDRIASGDRERDMSRRFYTILILPHANARLRKIHLSRNFVLTLVAILAGVLATGALAPHLLFKVSSQSEQIARLKADNRKLVQEKERFETSLGELESRLTTYEARTEQLADDLGVRDLPSSEPAAGGAAPPGAVRSPGLQPLLDEELDALKARSGQLDESLTRLDQAWAERAKMLASTPSIMPVAGFFSHGFGWRKDPFTGGREFHQGVDIVAPYGTPIVAPADGIVTRAHREGGYGKMVHISHGYGMATRYGHLSEILVRPGQRVHRGDVIGRVGSTGRSTGPHLHYEVFKGGRRVDPRKYLNDKAF